MLESLFSITRDFDMPTQPHLLLLQKTMVMKEGVATDLDPDINMWETAEPFLKRVDPLRAWARGLLCRPHHRGRPGAQEAPQLIERIDQYYPPLGARLPRRRCPRSR